MIVRLIGLSRLPAAARRPVLIRRAVRMGLGARSGQPGELNVVFVTDREIRELNKRHLRHDRATDVLAFPYLPPSQGARQDTPFGDVVISVDRARAQARELGHPVLREVLTLAAHGALHLAGHTDRRSAGRRRMFKRQDTIVRHLLRGVKS